MHIDQDESNSDLNSPPIDERNIVAKKNGPTRAISIETGVSKHLFLLAIDRFNKRQR